MSSLPVPSLQAAFAPTSPPASLRWFRNGIAPPASGPAMLADRLNVLMARRMRQLFAHAVAYNTSNTPVTAGNGAVYRWSCCTGPVTTKIRLALVFQATSSLTGTLQLTVTKGLVSSLDVTVLPVNYSIVGAAALNAELFMATQDVTVDPGTIYRFELASAGAPGLLAVTAMEVPSSSLDSTVTPLALDSSPFFFGGRILDAPITQLLAAAEAIWLRGHPLFWWNRDNAGISDTMATNSAAPVSGLNVGALADRSQDTASFPIAVPYSGTLDSSNVPVVMWCYASNNGGAGAVIWKDQAGNQLGKVDVAGPAKWYAVTGNVTDASGGTPTTNIRVYLNGDGVYTVSVEAIGMFMYGGAPSSWGYTNALGDVGLTPDLLTAANPTLAAIAGKQFFG